MKKLLSLLLFAAALTLVSTPAHALGNPDPKGTFVAGGSFGVLTGIGTALTGDYVLSDSLWKGHLTIGGQFTWNRQPQYSADFDINFDNLSIDTKLSKTYLHKFCIAPRVAYGLNITKSFEVHLGVAMGVGFIPHDKATFVIGDVLGLRYFFTDNLGASLELSPMYAVRWNDAWINLFSTLVNVGVSLKV